jgi:hypothetical protein
VPHRDGFGLGGGVWGCGRGGCGRGVCPPGIERCVGGLGGGFAIVYPFLVSPDPGFGTRSTVVVFGRRVASAIEMNFPDLLSRPTKVEPSFARLRVGGLGGGFAIDPLKASKSLDRVISSLVSRSAHVPSQSWQAGAQLLAS